MIIDYHSVAKNQDLFTHTIFLKCIHGPTFFIEEARKSMLQTTLCPHFELNSEPEAFFCASFMIEIGRTIHNIWYQDK